MSMREHGGQPAGCGRGTERAGRDAVDDDRSAGGSVTTASPVPAPDEPLIAELPEASAVALRLHGAGHPDATIATALGIPVQAVPVTLSIARAKLDALRRGT